MNDRLNGGFHKCGRVIDDVEIHAFRHGFLKIGHGGMNVFGDFKRIGAGCLKHTHTDSRLVVEQRAQGIISGAHFHTRNIAQPGDLAFATRLHDDIGKFFR